VGHVPGSSQLVCHGVADAQEGVGKGHACNGCCAVDLLPRLVVLGPVLVGSGQVLEQQADRLLGQALGGRQSRGDCKAEVTLW
jgi:hypothetical protein